MSWFRKKKKFPIIHPSMSIIMGEAYVKWLDKGLKEMYGG